jgi:glycerophosphoryl diester phosphodiesterase
MITGKPLNEWTINLAKSLGINRIGAKMPGTTRDAVKKAHKEGLIVSLWPGHSTADFVLGAYLGADYMCTDVPVAVKKFAEEKTPWLKVKY